MDESIYHVLKIKKNTQTNKKVTRSTLKKFLKKPMKRLHFQQSLILDTIPCLLPFV